MSRRSEKIVTSKPCQSGIKDLFFFFGFFFSFLCYFRIGPIFCDHCVQSPPCDFKSHSLSVSIVTWARGVKGKPLSATARVSSGVNLLQGRAHIEFGGTSGFFFVCGEENLQIISPNKEGGM